MSNSTSASAQELQVESLFNIAFTSDCAYIASLCFYLFDFCLTFDQQVRFLWGCSLSIPSVLLALLHFSAMLGGISQIGLDIALSCKSEGVWYYIDYGAAIVLEIVTAAISALRVYAINGRSCKLPSLIFALYIIPNIVQSTYSKITTKATDVPQVGCALIESNPKVMNGIYIASASAVLTANILVLGATWYHTFTVKKLAHAVGHKATLATLLLRDGTIYFGALLVLDVLEVVSNYSDTFVVFAAFPNSFTAVILTHFFINLRSAADPSQWSSTASMSDLQFSAPNDLGGQVIFNEDEDEFFDEHMEGEGGNGDEGITNDLEVDEQGAIYSGAVDEKLQGEDNMLASLA